MGFSLLYVQPAVVLGKGFQGKWRSHGSFQRGCPWPSLLSYILEVTEEEKTKEEKQEAKG